MYRLSVTVDVAAIAVNPGADGEVVALIGDRALLTGSPAEARELARRLVLAADAAEAPDGDGSDGVGGGK